MRSRIRRTVRRGATARPARTLTGSGPILAVADLQEHEADRHRDSNCDHAPADDSQLAIRHGCQRGTRERQSHRHDEARSGRPPPLGRAPRLTVTHTSCVPASQSRTRAAAHVGGPPDLAASARPYASKQDLVRGLGARPVVADALDPDAVARSGRSASAPSGCTEPIDGAGEAGASAPPASVNRAGIATTASRTPLQTAASTSSTRCAWAHSVEATRRCHAAAAVRVRVRSRRPYAARRRGPSGRPPAGSDLRANRAEAAECGRTSSRAPRR